MNLYSSEAFTNDNAAKNISIQFRLRQIGFHARDGTMSTKGKFNLVCLWV